MVVWSCVFVVRCVGEGKADAAHHHGGFDRVAVSCGLKENHSQFHLTGHTLPVTRAGGGAYEASKEGRAGPSPVHNVHEDHHAQPVRLINHGLQLIGRAKPAAMMEG